MHGELDQADGAAKKPEHTGAEINPHDARGTSPDSVRHCVKKAT